MAKDSHKFKVGLFVLGAAILGSGALIWLGASKFLSETRQYVTFFDESVQGLEEASSVKFMGVIVGNVKHIKVAPDGKLVQVNMETDADFEADDGMRATLAMAGITGMKYIEITRDPDSTPLTVPFKTEHPIIPSKKSATGQLFEAIEKVYDKIMETDFPGIGENAKEALAEIESVAQDPNIDKLIAQLAGAAERVNYLVHKHETEQTIVELAQTLTELRGLVATIKTSIEQADLKSTFGDLRLAAGNLNQMLERIDNEVAATLANLRRTTDNLSRITQDISDRPGQLLLSEPPP
ncbi:MAG: MCE family protein, partial [Deltaproteobacteria bacterium]|nr:MCE family protein [Deltaproteobacteria bacterium]